MNTHRSSYFLLASKIMILLFLGGAQVFGEENPSPEKIAQIRTAATGGDADSQFQLADIYRYGKGGKKDYRESLQWAQKAADQGHAQAQHYLGISYTYEMGVKKDLAEAFKWFQKSAEQGNVAGEYRLGMCFSNGDGVPKDDAKAIDLFLMAANGSDAEAMMELASIHHKLSRLEKDEYEKDFSLNRSEWKYRYSQITAYKWCNLAAAAGSTRAKKGLVIIAGEMLAVDIAEAQKRSSDWKPDRTFLIEQRAKQKIDEEQSKARAAKRIDEALENYKRTTGTADESR